MLVISYNIWKDEKDSEIPFVSDMQLYIQGVPIPTIQFTRHLDVQP